MDFPLDVLAIGEVLWDIFPDEKRLGGAPFNFAAHCRQLGAHSAMVSRVGCDALGDQAVARAQEIGVEHTLVQRDPAHPTGQVRVTGAVTSDYALREFADVGAQPARAHLAALAKGMATGARAPKAQQPFEGDWKAAITPEEMMAFTREFLELHRIHWPEWEGEVEIIELGDGMG